MFILPFLLLSVIPWTLANVFPNVAPVIDVGYAKYRGLRLAAGVDEYLGMRYAKPPLDEFRFRGPQDPDKLSTIQDAFKFGPICSGVNQDADETRGEDCLFVNVFKPSHTTERSKLPVWLYIQGGGYADNSNSNYNGTEVIRHSGNNIVFVNFNYRVGPLGFLASEEVRQKGDLNAGLLDQRKVLHWVRENIHKFGGDPQHVVLHGTSAGAGSVAHHLAAYGGCRDNDLFIGAIPQNPFWPTLRGVAEMEFQYQRLLTNANCSNIDCLRKLDFQQLKAVAGTQPFPGAASSDPLPLWYWLPVIDGEMVVDHLYKSFAQGRFVRVPMLVGDDSDEGTAFAYNAASSEEMATFLKNNFPRLTKTELNTIRRAYPQTAPLAQHKSFFPSTAAAYGDATFTCPGNHLAESFARYVHPDKVWDYRYNVIDPDNIARGLGVPHAMECPAIFGVDSVNGVGAPSYSTTNAPIVPITMAYFISFIRSLNPNTFRATGSPEWKAWGGAGGQRLRIQTNDTGMEVVPETLTRKCALYKGLSKVMEL